MVGAWRLLYKNFDNNVKYRVYYNIVDLPHCRKRRPSMQFYRVLIKKKKIDPLTQ